MIAEKYEKMRASAQDRLSEVGEYVNRSSEQVSHVVEQRPFGAVFFSWMAGFAVGLLVSRALTPEPSFSSTVDSNSAERFGRNLLDRVEHYMPAMLRDRLSR